MPPSEAQLAAPLAHGARVAFSGPLGGALAVRVSDDVARALAANMLGVDAAAATDPRLVRDALGEIANVICGNLLPELAGRRAVFDLGAPEAAPLEDPLGESPALVLALGIDGGRAEVALYVEPLLARMGRPIGR